MASSRWLVGVSAQRLARVRTGQPDLRTRLSCSRVMDGRFLAGSRVHAFAGNPVRDLLHGLVLAARRNSAAEAPEPASEDPESASEDLETASEDLESASKDLASASEDPESASEDR